MLSIRPVTTVEEFQTLAGPWNLLLRQTAADNVFLTWEWLSTWVKHYLGNNRLWVLLVYERTDRLVGIAPFYIHQAHTYGVFSLREIRFLGTDEVGSSYLDFIVANKHKSGVLHRIYRYLHEEAGGAWDTVTLSEIPAGSSTIDVWDSFIQEAGKVIDVVGTTACPLIELPARPEDLIERIAGRTRNNLQRKRKRLERAGHVDYERVSSPDDVGKALETFLQLHQMRWAKKGSPGVFASRRFLAFHQDIARVFSELGWVRLDFLRLNGEAVAGIYGYSYKGRYSFYLPGFDPTVLPQVSPGILLLVHSGEEAVREGHRQFDLLRGVADYKMAWANGLARCLTLRHYNHHVRSTAVKLLECAKDVVKVLVR